MSGKLSTPSASLVPLSQGDKANGKVKSETSNAVIHFLPLRQGEYPKGGRGGINGKVKGGNGKLSTPSVATLLVAPVSGGQSVTTE